MAPSQGCGTTTRANPHRAPPARGGLAPGAGRRPAHALAVAALCAVVAHACVIGTWVGAAAPQASLAPPEMPMVTHRIVLLPSPAPRATGVAPEALAADRVVEAPDAPRRGTMPPDASGAQTALGRAPSVAAAARPAHRAAGEGAPSGPVATADAPGTSTPLAPPGDIAAADGAPAKGDAAPVASPARSAIEGTARDAALTGPAVVGPLSPDGLPPPTYRTTPPPSATLDYEVSRGEAQGSALLRWRVEPDGRYVLEMQGSGTAPALAPHWTSRGTLDADGVAPERFAVSRRGRERHAANFRRDAGLVSFAGPARTWPLLGGAQDRLSWMVQLAAVLEANPALVAAGERVSMMVVGAHGDAGLWTFTVQPMVMVDGPGGTPVPAWPLRREAGQAHDPQVEVWVAPSLHHLPLRLRLTLPVNGESTDWRLRALQRP